ncbi:hypothetical protein DMUE_5794 [Dictyocoela muelleri]|nr:hypothetical protein DMUE_5794 [Dictyocoela muelleri]
MIETFVDSNIPLFKLQTPSLKNFLGKYTGKTLRGESYYRNKLQKIYTYERLKMLEVLRNKDIFLLFEETTDANARFILKIMGGIYSEFSNEKSYLLRTVELDKTDNQTVSQSIINLMIELYEGVIDFQKPRIVIMMLLHMQLKPLII